MSTQGSLPARALAEGLGTGMLVAAVVGSGIAAQQLSPGDVGLQLLENSTATALALVALILTFGPVSGAHLNPAVTLAERVTGRIDTRTTGAYVAAQVRPGWPRTHWGGCGTRPTCRAAPEGANDICRRRVRRTAVRLWSTPGT